MKIDWKRIQDFYFDAHIEGYLGGARKVDVPDKPGFRRIEVFGESGLRLVDEYSKTLGSHHSAGTTTIWFDNIPIWMMSYGGWYSPEALPILKAALRLSYERKKFIGGRGPESFSKDSFSYTNLVESWRFENFNGRESICRSEDSFWFGTHRYSGHALVSTR